MQYVYFAKGIYPRFRHPKTGDVPLPREPVQMHKRYAELLARVQAESPIIDKQSIGWLIKQYRASVEFRALAGRTQLDYDKTLDLIEAEIGSAEPYRFITRPVIKAIRDKLAATPRKAHKIVQMASALYSWADRADLVPQGFNPAHGIREIKRQKMMIMPWSDQELAKALKNPPTHIKTALYLALYTGQRAKDIAEMQWSRYDGDRIWVRQSKTGTLVDVPAHPALKAHLDPIKRDLGLMCISAGNRSYNSASLGAAIRVYMRGLGITDRTLHGIRFAVAVNLNEAGCSPAVCSSILGHKTYQMAMDYMRRKVDAQTAVGLMHDCA
ncbi:MAG: tyrosine-type recombinase/integrase [Pseudomonadota bacterium]